jgi:hypothetical protein
MRVGGDHAREVGGPASTGYDATEVTRVGGFCVFGEKVRRAVGRNDAAFVRDAEFFKNGGGFLHRAPVGSTAHDDSHEGLFRFGLGFFHEGPWLNRKAQKGETGKPRRIFD